MLDYPEMSKSYLDQWALNFGFDTKNLTEQKTRELLYNAIIKPFQFTFNNKYTILCA